MPRPARTTGKRPPATSTRAFLFSDLRDYTTFVETHGDAAAARLLRDYRTLVRREVARHQGAEVKTEGDSFYVVFDSASVALDCAVAILRKVRAVKNAPSALRIGIGLHAGETIAYDKQFVGSAVNIASRLASKAEAGELLISDTLRGLVRTGRSYPMTDRGPLALKGVSEPIQAWSVRVEEGDASPTVVLPPIPAPRVPPATGQILCPIVIGREAELGQADLALDAALGGRGQTIVVGGEAGGGKSAFVREVETRAHARGFRVLLGATLESDRTLPYAPFIAAVRSGFRGIERDRLGRVLAQTAPDLAQLFPELGRPSRPDAASAPEQHRLTVAFHGLFTAFAREGPILVVLEDLHWSDEASLDLLHYLARELRDSRSVILATYRSDEMHRRHPFLRTLATLQRERLTTEIALRRLTPGEVAALVRETFATANPVSDEFRDAIYARSEGNPFFTEELLKALVEAGGIYRTASGWERKPIDELRIPASIREAVHARIERLPTEAQGTLSAAAVIGSRFPFEVLRAAAGAAATDMLGHLRQFIDLQLVVEEGGDDDVYAFRHALTREVVYDELLAPERKALHRAVADVLESLPRTEPSLIAHHLIAAGAQARAIPHLLEAADRALAAGAPREAAGHYERALELGLEPGRMGRALEGLAHATLQFDMTRSQRAAERALIDHREANDGRGVVRSLTFLARMAAHNANPRRSDELARQAVEVATPLGDTTERARALLRLAMNRLYRGALEESRELAEHATTIAERLGDVSTIAEALAVRGMVLAGDRPGDALALFQQARALAIEHRLVQTAMWAYHRASFALQHLGESDERVLAFIDEAIAYTRRVGLESSPLVPRRAYFFLHAGRWDEALEEAGRIDKGTDWYDNALEITARIALAREGPAAARPLAAQYAEAWRRLTGGTDALPALALAALVAASAGDRGAARAALAAFGGRLGPDTEEAPNIGVRAGFSNWELILPAAWSVGEPTWLEQASAVIAAFEVNSPFVASNRALCNVFEALFADDFASAGREIEHVIPDTGYRAIFTLVFSGIVAFIAREALERGKVLGPEWDGPLRIARETATHLRAAWWLEQLERAPRAD